LVLGVAVRDEGVVERHWRGSRAVRAAHKQVKGRESSEQSVTPRAGPPWRANICRGNSGFGSKACRPPKAVGWGSMSDEGSPTRLASLGDLPLSGGVNVPRCLRIPSPSELAETCACPSAKAGTNGVR